jgi:hypothetical protein
MSSATVLKRYITSCQACEKEFETLAYPATIDMGNDSSGTSDDETSSQTPIQPATAEAKIPLIHDEDTKVEKECPSYAPHKNTCIGTTD